MLHQSDQTQLLFSPADFSLSTAAAAAACHVINLLAKKWEGLERKGEGEEE